MSDIQKFEVFKQACVQENEVRYGKEVREKHGNETVDTANANVLSLPPEAYAEWTSLGQEILTALTTAIRAQAVPSGQEGYRIAKLHRKWLSFSWKHYTPQAHAGLAQMYVEDPRFTAYYDREESGCAAFLRDAILAYTAL